MWIIINRQKADQLIFTDFWLLENLWTVKTSSHVRRRLSLDITRLYNHDLVISENILKFHMWKARTTSDTQNLLLINAEVNIYLKSWTKFSLNNHQPPKALKFNHQPSKLEKKLTINHWDPLTFGGFSQQNILLSLQAVFLL